MLSSVEQELYRLMFTGDTLARYLLLCRLSGRSIEVQKYFINLYIHTDLSPYARVVFKTNKIMDQDTQVDVILGGFRLNQRDYEILIVGSLAIITFLLFVGNEYVSISVSSPTTVNPTIEWVSNVPFSGASL